MNFLIFLSALPHPQVDLDGPWQLTLEGQLRPRVVAHSGRDFVSEEAFDQLYISQRSRLGFVVAHEDGTVVTLRLQDVRFWGEEKDTQDGTADGFDMHEAFLRLPLLEDTTLTVGRQVISWDQQRLVGAGNWTQRGRSFDGLRLRYQDEALDTEIIAVPVLTSANSHPPQGDADGHVDPARVDDVWLLGAHASGKVAEGLAISGLYLYRQNGALEEKRHTVGGLISYGQGGFTTSAEGYYQLGELGEATLGAWMGGLRLGYALDVALRPRLVLIGDVLSGDGTPEGAFDTLYGTNHGYYGELDFFTNIPVNTRGLGLVDLGGQASIEPTQGVVFKAAFHGLRSVEPGLGGDTAFGQEVDLNLEWQVSEPLRVAALVGFFLPGDLWSSLVGVADPSPEQALYLTTDYTF
jgi:hypothetical protein